MTKYLSHSTEKANYPRSSRRNESKIIQALSVTSNCQRNGKDKAGSFKIKYNKINSLGCGL